MPLTSPGNDDDTGENHQPTLRKNTAEPAQQILKQYTPRAGQHPRTDRQAAPPGGRQTAARDCRRPARVKDRDSATAWLVSYSRWEQDFASFLDEKSEYADGSVNGMHQRLVKARRMIPGASGRASRSRSSTRGSRPTR